VSHQFQKHYTRDEATALLPQVRDWLATLQRLQRSLDKSERRIESLGADGGGAGGTLVNDWTRTLADINEIFRAFQQREIQIKDLDRGLVDFPAIIGGKEVFLCWEDGEEDIEFWHDLDAGYAGREKL
jgi:hypothetical protein